jgi:hypothetical protein
VPLSRRVPYGDSTHWAVHYRHSRSGLTSPSIRTSPNACDGLQPYRSPGIIPGQAGLCRAPYPLVGARYASPYAGYYNLVHNPSLLLCRYWRKSAHANSYTVPNPGVRQTTAENRSCPLDTLQLLLRDSDLSVQAAAANNPSTSREIRAMWQLAH